VITKLHDAKKLRVVHVNMREKVRENTCRSRSVNLRSVDVAILMAPRQVGKRDAKTL
jgi:hypothetical protein